MRRALLGRTGIEVSPLCFGTIPLGPLRNMPTGDAVALLRRAYDLGVNFVDTAEIYGNYEVIRLSLQGFAGTVVIATKSYAPDEAGMRASIEKALRALDRDWIDLFLLHEVESVATLRGHRAALDCLLEARVRGQVAAVGVSTHTVAGVRAACAEPEIDVVHPLLNRQGLGIKDGTAAEMAEAIAAAASLGRGVYAMKVLAGGHLGHEAREAFAYVKNQPGVVSMAVGIQSEYELLADLAYCQGEDPPGPVLDAISARPRHLLVESWCTGCGECLHSCPSGLLSIVGGRARVRAEECLLCGYCARACANLCLKVV